MGKIRLQSKKGKRGRNVWGGMAKKRQRERFRLLHPEGRKAWSKKRKRLKRKD